MSDVVPGSPEAVQDKVEDQVAAGVDPDLAAKAAEDKAPQPDPVVTVPDSQVTPVADVVGAPVEPKPFDGELPPEQTQTAESGKTVPFETHLENDQVRRQALSAREDAAILLEEAEAKYLEADAAVRAIDNA